MSENTRPAGVSRRRLLKSMTGLLGLAAASSFIAACGNAAPPAAPASSGSAPAGSGAAPAAAGAATSAPKPAAAAGAPAATGGQDIVLNWWSHGAEEENKKRMIGVLIKNFEEKNPGTKVNMTWNQMPGIWQALQAAFTADSGYPDIFWFSLAQRQWIDAGWVADLTNGISWDNMQPWAKESATVKGPDGKPGVFFLVEYAVTTETYYNKQIFSDAGITVPADGQFSEDAFLDAVKTITGKGLAAYANANGDRDYPGQIPLTQILLAKLGPDDYIKLWKGEVPWTDPRVVACFEYFEAISKAKAFPTTFSSMTLSESHNYFHTQKKAGMFAVPSWYTSRAFVPADKGGQPKDFQLGFLAYPGMKDGKGLKSKFLDAGGAHTVAAKSKYRDQAIKVLNGLTDPTWAADWVGATGNLTAAKVDPTKVKSEYQDYWDAYFKAQQGYTAVPNLGNALYAKPGQIEVWTAVASQGMPPGLLTAKEAIAKLDEGWKKNAN